MEYSIEKIRENIDALKEEKSNHESNGQKLIFDNEIAEKLGISPSTYCKRLSGTSKFYANELVALADFFKVTCDEIVTDISSKDNTGYENPLDKATMAWINRFNYEFPDCIALLNIILNNNDKYNLGERLLKTILYYCYGDIFKISSVTDSTPINADSSIRMLKLLALDDLSYLLDDIAREWKREMEKPDSPLKKAIHEKGNTLSPEARRRLGIKSKSNLKMKKGKTSTVKLINLIEDLKE